MAEDSAKELSNQEILSTLILYTQLNAIEVKYPESYDKGKIDKALDALTSEKIKSIKEENHGYIPKLFYTWAVGYKDPGYTPPNKWEIDQIITHVQKRFLEMPDLLISKDSDTANSPTLMVSMVKNATPDLLEEIIIRPNIMKMPADAPGYNNYGGNTIAHLVVSRVSAGIYESGGGGYDRKALEIELITEYPDVLALRNRQQESVLNIIERLVSEWKDKTLMGKIQKAKADMQEGEQELGEKLS